ALGAVGAAVGVPLGVGLGRLLLRSVSESAELVFSMKIFTAGLAVSPATLGLGLASGIGAALLAGWLPAREALRVEPLAAVRRGDPPPASRRWPASGSLAAALAITGAGLSGEVWLDSPWSGDLAVASAATTGWIETPVDESLAARLLAVPGVARVECLRLAEQEYDGSRISVDSLDDTAFAPERASDFTFAAGDPATALAAVHAGTAAAVSRHFARQFRVGVGSTLRVPTPAGAFTAPVAGVVVDYVSPRGSIVLSRATYQRWWGDRAVNRFHVTLGPGVDAAAVRRAIAGGVGAEEGLKVLTQRDLYAYHQDAVRRAFRFTRALEVLPLVVAGLGLAEALIAVSLDRRRELALLRAAGA